MDLQHNDDLDPVAIRHFSVIPSKKTGLIRHFLCPKGVLLTR